LIESGDQGQWTHSIMNQKESGGTSVTVRLSKYPELGPPPSLTGGAGFEQVRVVAKRGGKVANGIPVPNAHASPQRTIPTQQQMRFANRLGEISDNEVSGGAFGAAEKMNVADNALYADKAPRNGEGIGEKEGSVGAGLGSGGEGVGNGIPGGKRADSGGAFGEPSGSGGGIGAGIRKPSYSVEWNGKGTRSKVSGMLPGYPPGVNKAAQIKIQITVLPDGTVRQMAPLQKGDAQLEDAAMRALRNWKFAPLKPTQPQVEQTAVVTFYFKLE